MNWEAGVSLFRDIWNTIDDTIAEESPERRISITKHLLAAFALSGADIRELYGHSEDIDASLQSLGVSQIETNVPSNPLEFTLDLTRMDVPEPYTFFGGPYDGSMFRVGTDFGELPPVAVTFTRDSPEIEGDQTDTYRLHNKQSFNNQDEFVGEIIGYFHVDSAEHSN